MHIKFKHLFASLLAAGLICLAAGCSSSNPSEALQKELKTIVSWIETTRVVGQAWSGGAVPQAYTDRTFQTAQQNIQTEAETIQSLSIPGSDKADLLAKLRELQNALGQGVVAIKKGDRSALTVTIDQLTATKQVSDAWSTKPMPQSPKP